MKESRYVKLARTMLNILMRARVPLYMHGRSNHIYTVWQHIILLALRQYECKSYRRFTEWLDEAYYLRTYLQLDRIPHYTTLQKFAARINGTLLYRIIASFILQTRVRKMFIGIDASGFKSSNASSYYSEIAGVRRKYIKLSICAELRKQLACALKIRRAPRHDTIDFEPAIVRASNIMPLSIVVADKGYDSEANHELVREHLDAMSMIPARYGDVPVWKTYGRYRKQMKRRFYWGIYYQRNKNETILSVIKRMFGEHVASRLVKMQNRELIFKVIAYNMHRLTVFIVWFLQSLRTDWAAYYADDPEIMVYHTNLQSRDRNGYK